MKLLIGASSSKIFHLKEFAKKLEEYNIETKIVFDIDYADGFPNRKISKWFSSNKKFKKLVNEFKPDVIFVDRTKHFALEASKTDIPLIIHLRGDHWAEIIMAKETLYKSGGRKIAINKWEKMGEECFKNSKLILPICNHLSKITKKRYSGKPVETMYQAINSENWFHKKGIELEHPCVGILQSATIWEKTKEMKILPEVLEKMPDVHFYWAGDGIYRDEVLPLLEKYENFHWLGSLEYPDKVRQFLTEIDVYALLSGIDMSPHTLLEAGLMEKPILATNAGGISESCKDNETCFLIEKNNHDEWIEKITLLFNNKEKMDEMGKKGKIFVKENFLWEKITDDFLKLLKSMRI